MNAAPRRKIQTTSLTTRETTHQTREGSPGKKLKSSQRIGIALKSLFTWVIVREECKRSISTMNRWFFVDAIELNLSDVIVDVFGCYGGLANTSCFLAFTFGV